MSSWLKSLSLLCVRERAFSDPFNFFICFHGWKVPFDGVSSSSTRQIHSECVLCVEIGFVWCCGALTRMNKLTKEHNLLCDASWVVLRIKKEFHIIRIVQCRVEVEVNVVWVCETNRVNRRLSPWRPETMNFISLRPFECYHHTNIPHKHFIYAIWFLKKVKVPEIFHHHPSSPDRTIKRALEWEFHENKKNPF